MTRVTVDPTLRAKLNGLNEELEFCDESGQTLGRFVPESSYEELVLAWVNAQYTDEELDRRRNEPGGRSLKEIWQRLGRTA